MPETRRKNTMAAPVSRPFTTPLVVVFALLAVTGLWYMRVEVVLSGIPVGFDELIYEKHQLADGSPLQTKFIGLPPVDGLLSMLVGAFMGGAAGWEPHIQIQQWYFLLQWFPVICVWTVESHRLFCAGRVVRFTGVFALIYQMIGGAVIAPIYYALDIAGTARSRTSKRQLSPAVAKALLPATLLGYFIPTVLLYLPWHRVSDNPIDLLQILIAVWQPAPALPNLLIQLFTFGKTVAPASSSSRDAQKQRSQIRRLYAIAGVLSVTTHFLMAWLCAASTDPRVSFSSVLLPDRATRGRDAMHGLLWIFQIDFWVCFVSTLLWSWVAVVDVMQDGGKQASWMNILSVGLLGGLVSVVLGPGTAVAAGWYWMESVSGKVDNSVPKKRI
ncbi:hypothetical protein QBC47DRAFT_121375 [Echria macrotheca]|uniref:Uncharacterized protein n=1 Tax=Echria macrotheca TaxID=438768 RepID=A0AAJ0F1X6_9PEZI|nr:hypothetical protein QBC47DRAFT_121375 [Echria macrotheca]